MFDLGEICPSLLSKKRAVGLNINLMDLLTRHSSCDWPELTATEKRLNEEAIEKNRMVYSRYGFGTNIFLISTNLKEGFTDIKMGDE